MDAPLRLWRIADQASLAWHYWDGEYVFHHALSNDTHRLSDIAGVVLRHLLDGGETEEHALAEACGLNREDLDVILSALAKIDFVAWR
jgi:hypothetical protein